MDIKYFRFVYGTNDLGEVTQDTVECTLEEFEVDVLWHDAEVEYLRYPDATHLMALNYWRP